MNKKEFNYNGFIYSKNGVEQNGLKRTTTLFKYYSLNKNSIDAFLNNYLYFSHPNQLNDLLDSSSLLLDVTDCDENFYENYTKAWIKNMNGDYKMIPPYEEEKQNSFRSIAELIYLSHFRNIGILSLTNSPFNNLMMPHYTNEKGFLLEIDVDKLEKDFEKKSDEFIKIFPMNYVEELQPINYFDNIIKVNSDYKIQNNYYKKTVTIDDTIPILYLLSVKDKNWKYENEWRIILYKKSLGNVSLVNDFNDIKELIDRKVNFNHNYISKIILAPMFFNKELFQSEVNINGIISYKLLPKKNYRDLKFFEFLSKLSSKKFEGKIFIQNIGFEKKGYNRFIQNLENISFKNGTFSFTLSEIKIFFKDH